MDSTETMPGAVTGLAAIEPLFEQASREVCAEHTGVTDVEVQEVGAAIRPVAGHVMTVILVGNEKVRMMFRVFYGDKQMRSVLQDSLGLKIDKMPSHFVRDFMKEFCNQVAGRVKETFNSCEINIGISLPLVARGFDELVFLYGSAREFSLGRWALPIGKTQIICSVATEVIIPGALDQLALSLRPTPSVSSSVELL